jgi:K+-transporting ATPase KdpF subunit
MWTPIESHRYSQKGHIHGRCISAAHAGARGTVAGPDFRLQLSNGRENVIYAIAGLGAVALLVYLTVSLLKPEWF